MEFILELILQFFGEFVIQVVFEGLVEVVSHVFQRSRPVGTTKLIARTLGYAILGFICGAVSVWLFPNYLLISNRARVVYLLAAPVGVGAFMALVGVLRERRGQERLGLDRFACGYLFALAFALVRFAFASVGA